ncbi:hypothetical protein BJ138DRAFT_1113634 [Hygrophoropsis aurantiaca]|uniref:Uncharacterized protein n=1 Tax=Hygrophoropsis aurantiaca TaxID=72124 RepID=A0ACB8ADP3_9AGAM|nr:hypothetical protein BJ138DRAFT_1113634 [Hygrophoropsis aurantiaca]
MLPQTEFSSPARKRMRLSSPTYDDQLDDLNQDDINALDAIEAKLTQQDPPQTEDLQTTTYHSTPALRPLPETLSSQPMDTDFSSQGAALQDDDDNPFTSKVDRSDRDSNKTPMLPDLVGGNGMSMYAAFMKASAVLPPADLQAAACDPHDSLRDASRSPSPVDPAEIDYSSWFQPGSTSGFAGFKSATRILDSSHNIPDSLFVTATSLTSIKTLPAAKVDAFITPSISALRRAEERLKLWEGDTHDPSSSQSPPKPAPSMLTISQPISPRRTVLGAVQNASTSISIPETPTPIPTSVKLGTLTTLPAFRTPTLGTAMRGKIRPKPFKTPFMNVHKPQPTLSESSPKLSFMDSPSNARSVPINSQHELTFSPVPSTPLHSPLAASQSGSFVAVPSINRATPARRKFVTPFKSGVTQGDPKPISLDLESTRATTSSSQCTRSYPPPISQPISASKGKRKSSDTVFDLSSPCRRISLAASGLYPQATGVSELNNNTGLNMLDFSRVTLDNALSYAFPLSETASRPRSPFSSSSGLFGYATALEELVAGGCSLATEAWVKNHWPLILWKLAGMAALEPQREDNPHLRRWSRHEVMQQLLYERDLNGSSRPPLRLITTRDAPAASPMVLCVSNITWSPAGIDDDGFPTPPFPELEVTDGWYRLRARVDEPLARAIRKGTIRVGRKIGIAGAKLDSERKDPSEILEAYASNVLLISGNSSHLAPWHSKLGFQAGPFISTLNSLTPDGGTVAVMAVDIIKAYPIAYLEFVEDEKGNKRREGPRNEKDEAKINAQWRRRREIHASKLWSDFEKRIKLLDDYIERLEQKAGPRFCPKDEDSPPEIVDSLCDTILDDPSQAKTILARVNASDAGWLALRIREQETKEKEAARDDIERELQVRDHLVHDEFFDNIP